MTVCMSYVTAYTTSSVLQKLFDPQMERQNRQRESVCVENRASIEELPWGRLL